MINANTVSSDTTTIGAPIELVWAVLVDFSKYGTWNPFCPSCDAKLEVGAAITMQIDLGAGLQEQTEYITRIEPCTAIAWGMENKPGDPIHALRTQYLTKLDDNSCSYLSVDEFSGDATPQMMELMATAIELGFNRCAIGLKHYCEQQFAEMK